jgi:esterase/lipase superfamily enzyme
LHVKEAAFAKDHAFVFVHGYATSFEHALYRTAQLAYDLGDDGHPFGTAFLYSWPSGGGVADYKHDFDSARLSVDHLTAFIRIVAARTDASHIHLIAHSMGNWPLLAALDRLELPPSDRSKLVDVSAISTALLSLAHSEYAERRGLLIDLALILREGVRPPPKRTPILRTLRGDRGEWWRFPN